jgi:anti-sigma factor ChrR (cupin superfamily)
VPVLSTAYTLYQRYTLDELVAMLQQLQAQAAQQPNSIYLHPKPVRNKMEAITWAIRYHMQKTPQ